MSTITARLRGWLESSDLNDVTAPLCCDMLEYRQERIERQVGNLAAPESFHAVQIQVLKAHQLIPIAEPMRQLKEPIAAAVSRSLVDL